jgi:hypothetical protein
LLFTQPAQPLNVTGNETRADLMKQLPEIVNDDYLEECDRVHSGFVHRTPRDCLIAVGELILVLTAPCKR